MKQTPKILPTYYKSKGTPIFRDTTALPFAKGGPLPEEPVNPVNPPSWNRPQLSPERIAALKELHGDNIFASANPNDLLFYDLNKEIIEGAKDFSEFLDPSAKVNPRFTDAIMTKDIKTRLAKQGYALDTKTGNYFKVPDEVLDLITRPEPEPLEKLEPLRPELISRNIPTQLSLPPQPEVLQYQMPGYMKSYNFPTVGRYTPLAAKAVQKVTGYDRNFMEGYYDEEGNYVPGELENAREQNRAPQFQGASSLKDIFAQRAYQQALENSKSFGQGGTIHFERSEYGSDAREHYDNGGPIYTYSKRPGSYYQRAADGSWMINNSSTGGQYVPIDDPTGQRTALLNKHAVVYNPPAQGAPKPVVNQAVWDKAQKQGENDLAKQALINRTREGSQGLYMPDGSLRPQAAQAADWVPQAIMAAPIALEALGAAATAEIPFTGGVTLGGVANAAGIAHGASEIDDRYKDWQDVSAGNMDWKEAALKTGLTGLEFAGAGIPVSNASKYIKAANIPSINSGAQTLATAEAPKKVVGIIDEFGDLVEDVPQYFPIGESVSINANKAANAIDLSNQNRAIDLDAWKKAQGQAEVNNWRFVVPRQEEEFLAAKYAQEFSDKYGIALDKLTSSDVALYGKMKEAEFLPTREVIPASEKLVGNTKALHENFVTQHNPQYSLNPQEELVTDAYTRGYDRLINQREFRAGEFYENEVAPVLEQTILKNKFQQETPLIRGTRDFTIDGKASVLRNNQALNNLKFSQLQEGDIFIPNSFISTNIEGINTGNLDEIPFTGFTRGTRNFDHVINAPAGQSYLYPNASNIQNYTTEMEAILPKNLQFKVDKVVSDLDRGYLETAADIKRGEYYGIGNNKFTKVPNRFFPSIQRFDKVKTVGRDLNTGELTYGKVSKKGIDKLIKYHNEQHQPIIPKYYFSIVNPYLFGGRLNKNC